MRLTFKPKRHIPHTNGSVMDVTPPTPEQIQRHARRRAGLKAAETRRLNQAAALKASRTRKVTVK